MNKRASRTPARLHALRLAFPPVVTLVLVVLTEWIARGSLTVDTLTQYIFPHAEAYLLAWALLFLIWLMVDRGHFRLCPGGGGFLHAAAAR